MIFFHNLAWTLAFISGIIILFKAACATYYTLNPIERYRKYGIAGVTFPLRYWPWVFIISVISIVMTVAGKINNTTKQTSIANMKDKGYSQVKAAARLARKRNAAEDRQAEYDALTPAEKLALARNPRRRGESKREIARLLKNHPELGQEAPAKSVKVTKPTKPVTEKKARAPKAKAKV